MLLLDTSFLIEFENELARARPGPASALLATRRKVPAAIVRLRAYPGLIICRSEARAEIVTSCPKSERCVSFINDLSSDLHMTVTSLKGGER